MNWKPGDRVTHPNRPEWGIGVVRNIKSDGKIAIYFEEVGEKLFRDPPLVAASNSDTSKVLQLGDMVFEWPSTDAPASKYGYIGDFFFYEEGLLSFVGYEVGQQGQPVRLRRLILNCVVHNRLPSVNSATYMREWGTPRSSKRLEKLADTIAALARNAKRRKTADYSLAVSDWEQDLEYLYSKFYDGKIFIRRPSSKINEKASSSSLPNNSL